MDPDRTRWLLSTRNRRTNSSHQRKFSRVRLRVIATWFLLLGTMSGCHELNIRAWFDRDEAMRQNVREALRGEEGHSKLIGDYIKDCGFDARVYQSPGSRTCDSP